MNDGAERREMISARTRAGCRIERDRNDEMNATHAINSEEHQVRRDHSTSRVSQLKEWTYPSTTSYRR